MTKKIFLWTAPRCISTAFARAMMEIKKSKVLHEPYRGPYYHGPDRISNRYDSSTIDQNLTFSYIDKIISKKYDYEVVFVKDMAYYIEGCFERLLLPEFADFQHTFLIRNPKQSIPSLYRLSVDKRLTNWDYFEPMESGIMQLYELYNFVKENIDENPVVVDAVDLLTNPDETMKAYTKATNLEYTPNLISWSDQPFLEGLWSGWHENLLKSNGFSKKSYQEAGKCQELSIFPNEVQNTIRMNFPYYLHLKNFSLQPTTEN